MEWSPEDSWTIGRNQEGDEETGRVMKEAVEEGRAVIMEQEVLLWLVAVELDAELLVLLLCCCLLPRLFS